MNATSPSRRPLMANHNRCWIWGRNVVLETFRAGYWSALELLHSDRCEPNARAEAVALAAQWGVEANAVRDDEVAKRCRSEDHQGLAARMPPFPYRDFEDMLKVLPSQPVLLMLDRLQDPFNFGAIIRSADVLGINGIIVGTREQAGVNSLVVRSSAGAVNYVPIAQTDDLVNSAVILRDRGFQIVGTSDHAAESSFEPNFTTATVLVIGNEGRGIQPAIESQCSRFVQIPVLGHVGSLNAAVSAGILFYEVLRQRRG